MAELIWLGSGFISSVFLCINIKKTSNINYLIIILLGTSLGVICAALVLAAIAFSCIPTGEGQ